MSSQSQARVNSVSPSTCRLAPVAWHLSPGTCRLAHVAWFLVSFQLRHTATEHIIVIFIHRIGAGVIRIILGGPILNASQHPVMNYG